MFSALFPKPDLPHGVDHTTPARLKASAIGAADFIRELAKIASRVLLLLDAGRSGLLLSEERSPDKLRAILNAGNVSVLTSSKANQLSFEDDKWQHGAFTKVLLDALSGSADLDRDGVISLQELVAYVDEHLSKLTDGRQQLGFSLRFAGNIFGFNRSAAAARVP
jgi:uncharacterized caspase-like protein